MIISYLKSKSFVRPVLLVVAFVLIHVVLFQVGNPKYYDLSRTLIQWDGQHYLSIARDGYEKFPCGFDPTYICGNIGWFPMLPLVSRIPASIGITPEWSLILTSWLSFLLGMLLLYRLIEKKYSEKTSLLTLIALIIFPGAFYFLTAFPNSLYFLLAVTMFYLIEERRFTWLWVPSAMLAVTHPTGMVMGLPLVYLFVAERKSHTGRDRLMILTAMLTMAAAIAIYFGYYWVRFDDFMLYSRFQAQSYYAHQMAFPFVTIYQLFANPSADMYDFVMLVFVIAVVALCYTRRVPVGWQIFMFGLLLFSPTMGTTDSYFRYIEAAFPLFLMIALRTETLWGRILYGLYSASSLVLWWTVFLSGYRSGLLR